VTVARTRIGRVRMKSGGADLRVLHQTTPNPEGKNYRGALLNGARKISEMGSPGSDLVGFFIVGFFSDGSASVGFHWDNERSPIPRSLMPAYVAELVRRDMITCPEADEVAVAVVNRANGFEE